ncbi:MAG: BREX system P-loop protein BrxC [Aggregatilineales bacterium]
MNLNEIFQKAVDRPIEGVIKADDEAGLAVEVEEYVLTNEIEKRLEAFLIAYNNYNNANGVWISGFFGSGKSHLLKMLAYLFESNINDDIFASFEEKCGDNKILRAEIKKAVSIPSQSILFNIDQKADVISKSDLDALLGVFVKVFNEMQGYFGKQGYIAKFERDLDDRNLYQAFQDEYRNVSGNEWQWGREQSILEADNIAKAYANVTGSSTDSSIDLLDKYRDSYSVSIEDFAEMVNHYIQRQDGEFRLNFFVDEVGQYIADNIKLMTNLQTIAESLATKCRGRAWIIVTAQEDMNTVVGEMNNQQGNDFSKIQARFATRMKLTSQDVAEVIQKRLLAKNNTGVSELTYLYQGQVNNFKTLFDFTDGVQFRNYRDDEHFINAYPFIPYQFVLFQSAIQSLSQHNAFEGKHSSVGERSMLGVFQQVAMHIGDHEIGELATFDLMFEGIRSSLKANTQRSIFTAEKNLDNAFAVKLLKALFLVKYVKEFKASERNLTVLMTQKFGQDISKLRKQIEEALNILEQQTYIQRSGTLYEYLTDEEKDVEQEIKNTNVDSSNVVDELGTIVFDRIIKETKLRSDDGPYSYPFTRLLDGRQFRGKAYELAINLITPFNENSINLNILRSQSMGLDTLFIVMPADDRIVRDLTIHEQTKKYFQQNMNSTTNDRIKLILNNKQYQNNERYTDIERQARDLLAGATYIINGQDISLNSNDAQTKVFVGFQQLIRTTYTHLKMLPNTVFKDTDIRQYLEAGNDLFGGDSIEMTEPERELVNHIQMQTKNGQRVTMHSLVERFERKPYGWYLAAIQCNLAKIYARGRVEIRQDGNALEGNEIEQALLNTRLYPNLILAPEEDYSPAQVRVLKKFFNEFFDKPPTSEDAKELATQTKTELQQQWKDLNTLVSTHSYPFLRALEPVIKQLQEVTGKPFSWYLTDFGEDADVLLDMKEDFISPIRAFMNGGQRAIYDEARDFLKTQQANLQSIDASGYDDALKIQVTLDDVDCFRGENMRQVKKLVTDLQTQIDTVLEDAKLASLDDLKALYEKLAQEDRFKQLPQLRQEHIYESFKASADQIENYSVIALVRAEATRFREVAISRILMQIDEFLRAEQASSGGSAPVAVAQYVRSSEINIGFDKLTLDDETDLETYLQHLHDAYLQQIRSGKRIQL